ncbi:APC family permease [Streptomyces vietnamensis]|uniref:APC family permease n=1 Tax=Streptomyces vietnamensis TaxID=362257 RepID=UPI00342BD801
MSGTGSTGAAAEVETPHLEAGHLGRGTLVSLSLASFFPAVGIALVPTLVLTATGNASAWHATLLAAVCVVLIGRPIIVFARRFVATGSLYSYISEVFGPWARYLTGAAMVSGFVCGVGGLAMLVGLFVGSFVHGRQADPTDLSPLEFPTQVVIFALAFLIASAIAYRGLDSSVLIVVGLAVLSIPLVLFITIASARHTGLQLATQFDFGQFSLGSTLRGVAIGIAFLVGFESSAALAAETRDPRRNVPVAIMAVPVVLGAVYTVATILQVPGLLQARGQLAAGASPPAALAVQAGLGTTVGAATDLVLAAACFSSLIAFVNYGTRFALAMAEDGLLPAFLTRIHPKFHSPHVAIVSLAVACFTFISAAVFLVGDVASAYNALTTLLVYIWALPYVLIAAGAIVLTRRTGELRPGLWISAVLGGAAMAWTYANGWINPPAAPADSMAWIAVVAVVVVLALIGLSSLRRRGARQPAAAEG